MQNFVNELDSRGLIAQKSHDGELSEHISTEAQPTVYTGFDPTADSLHVGSLMPLMGLRRLQKSGCRIIVLMGGATGYIGDPTGKTSLRKMLGREELDHNIESIKKQIGEIINLDGKSGIVVNNQDWFQEKGYLSFLREVGAQFSVNRMLTAECFKQRMESGLSFLEFNYMVLQAYDFLHLFREYGCTMQAGGDDQWSNMLAGMDLIRRNEESRAFCFTYPLITTTDGKKMGKTEKGAVWIDPKKTSPYEYYQYWRNIDDDMVIKCLKYFTEIPMSEIEEYSKYEGAQLNKLKEILGFETTKILHGEEHAATSRKTAKELFTGGGSSNAPKIEITQSALKENENILSLLAFTKICPSKAEARRVVQQGGLQIEGTKVSDIKHIVDVSGFQGSPPTLNIKRGKKHHYRLILT